MLILYLTYTAILKLDKAATTRRKISPSNYEGKCVTSLRMLLARWYKSYEAVYFRV